MDSLFDTLQSYKEQGKRDEAQYINKSINQSNYLLSRGAAFRGLLYIISNVHATKHVTEEQMVKVTTTTAALEFNVYF